MKNSNILRQAAETLYQARQSKKACAPISQTYAVREIRDAYEIQAHNIERSLSLRDKRTGFKIGLTSEVVQKQLGVEQPDFGVLLSSMELLDGAEIDTQQLIRPKVEGEIAFVIGQDIDDKELSFGALLQSIEYCLPALEVVDSAIENWEITITDTIADNASAALYVLGSTPTRLDGLTLELEGMLVHKNRQLVGTGVGAACLGHPLNAVRWLVMTMLELGQPIKAGSVILSGALGPMIEVQKGDSIELELTRLGRVGCVFV